jgi:lipopolysaccharide export system protein LptA
MSFPTKRAAGYAGLFILLILLLTNTGSFAQKRLRYKAEKQEGRRIEGVRIDYLIDNVIIKQDETTIYADSAIIQQKERTAEAFGNVRVTEGDSVDIRAKTLLYGGGSGTARLRQDVVYRDGETTLFTDSLDYNKFDGIARYFGGGRMVDKENTLISQSGIFDKKNQIARFYGGVKLESKDGTVNSDTLFYNTATKVATFKGPTTTIRPDGSESYAETGLVYDTGSKNTTLMSGEIENEDYIITGQSLNYDQLNDLFTATGNVVMTSKKDDVIITGGRSVYNKKTGQTFVYDNPVMRKPVEGDTLFLAADTLVSIEAELDADKRLLAYNNVRIYKNDLQGIADSLVYFLADSSLFFYQDPVLWNDESQMSGDTISVRMRENEIEQLRLRSNGFMISKDTIGNFNQVKGRQITAFFEESELNRVNVEGNGESIYFVLEEEDNTLVGMNRITSGSMGMHFLAKQLNHINFYQDPEGKFMPPHEVEEPDKQLSGFAWRSDERPSREGVIYGMKKEKEESDEAVDKENKPSLPKGERLPTEKNRPEISPRQLKKQDQ